MAYNEFMTDRFPEDFLWGASTSAYQVEGSNFNSDWSKWETETGREKAGKACEHYDRFRRDFAIAKNLGHNAHRLGIEWSRLEPSEGKFDDNAWAHYAEVIDELLSNGIEPILTLHHFTLPLWFADKGGWLNEKSPRIFRRFAEKAAEKLGKRVRYWITINEPNILAILAYFWGQWPPCHKDLKEAVSVLNNMLRAHALSYSAIKEHSGEASMVGIAKAVTAFHPYSLISPADRLSVYFRDRFHNHTFVSSLIKGKIGFDVSKNEKLHRSRTLDFIGLNYYFRQFIRGGISCLKDPFGEVASPPPRAGKREITDMGWEVYPEGLYEVAKAFSKYRLPLMITENGIAATDDEKRVEYIRTHLQALLKAIMEGVPVKGYLHWSLLDNFEWDSGYSKKFGLVEVDLKTQARSIRPSANYYSGIIRSGIVK